MKVVNRIGIQMTPEGLARLRYLTDKFSVSQSRLIAAFCSVTPDKDIEDVLERFDRLEAIESELKQFANQNLLDYIRPCTTNSRRE